MAIRDRHPQHFARFDRQRLLAILTGIAAFALLLFGMAQLGFFGGTLLSGSLRLVEIAGLMLPPDPGSWAHARIFGMALLETVAIAFLGTLSAAILALPVALLAARNVTASRVVRFFSRRSLDTIRSVDILVWALIWINVVGLGPFAGALAIMTADIGSFGKLFSEAMEAADRKPVEGIVSTGGSHALGIRFGILPEVFPVLASQVLYLLRIEHALGQHHRHRRRRRHRPSSRRSHPHPRTATNLVHHCPHLDRRRPDRFRLQPPALRHDRPAGSHGLSGEGAAAPRYALYYAPRPGDGLAVAAGQWLGRDPETGQTRALRPVPGVAMDRLVEITAEPRLYGFHGTLKAPIALADDVTERDFLAAVGRFAAERPRLRDSRARACRDLGLSRPRAGGALHRAAGPGRPLRRGVRRIPPACKRGRAGATARAPA